MLGRAFVVWCGLLATAVANGAFREMVLIPRMGPRAGHVVSTLMLSIAIVVGTYLAIPWLRPSGPSQAIAIGAGWLVLTLGFEFGFGRYRGRTWAELFADYDLSAGRIWILVLLATLLAPLLTARIRGGVTIANSA
jgi:hypothetical protein